MPGYPFKTAIQVAGAQILVEYDVLLSPVTGISRPGITREYSGNWQKGIYACL